MEETPLKTLIAWDNASEAELLVLYLAAGNNAAEVVHTADEFLAWAAHGAWDVVLMPLTFPTSAEEGFQLFCQVQQLLPGVPVVLAFRQGEMVSLARFLLRGLRFYLVRDSGGDFIFLALSCLESAVEATRAEEARKLSERLREEMEGVRRLQEALIPQGLQPPAGYHVSARYEPAQLTVVGGRSVAMAGGDYYDLFRPDDETLIVLVGDASGHGLKACMSIMAMHTLVRMLSGNRFRDTAAFVGEINNGLCKNSIVQSDGGFITLFYAAIDTVRHKLTWTSAGHPLALVHRRGHGDVVAVGTDADGDMPLGVMPDIAYSAGTVDLPANSRILIYSDGLPDAFPMNGDGHQAFGVNGIIEALRFSNDRSLDQAMEHLFTASNAFTAGTGRHDDTSVVLVERDGQ